MTDAVERSMSVVNLCTCGRTHSMRVRMDDWAEWTTNPRARHVQDIFPYLTAGEREMLITGICPGCWDALIANSEHDDDDE